MAEREPNRYPSNQAYISQNTSSNRSSNPPKDHSPTSSMRASVLAERVQDLEQQLVSIATALNEDGRDNQIWQQQLMKEHKEINEQLMKRQKELNAVTYALKLSQEEKQQLKDNLFKQNEEFEHLHRQLQEARTHNSRFTSKQLEEKVLELNDQISTLLVKIQQLLEENNQHIAFIQDLQKTVNQYKANQELYQAEIQRLNDQNNYLKEEIKQVQTLAITQQTQTQDRYLQQLQQAKVHIQELKKSQHEGGRQAQKNILKPSIAAQSNPLTKQNTKLRAEVHSLQEQLLQQREFERSIKKKYEEKLISAEADNEKLAQEISKLKSANRNLQRLCSDHTFALQQLQLQKRNPDRNHLQYEEQYKNIIIRLQSQKQEMAMKMAKAQIQMKYEQSTQFYSSLLREYQIKIQKLKQQLIVSEQQLAKSRRSVRQFSQLAKRWEEDYRKLSKDYQDAFIIRRRFEQRTKQQQVQLDKHKERYERLVSKCEQSDFQYRELQQKLRFYEQSKGKPVLYDKESSELIKLQNSMLRQQITQLKHSLQQCNSQMSHKDSKNQDAYFRQIESHKQRQRQLQRLVQMLRNRLDSASINSKEADLLKIRQLNEQLTRVNKMLNQREIELDSFKAKYSDLQDYLGRRQEPVTITKHHPEYTRLKNQFVALQRKLMEAQLYYKNSIQNANYEMQSLKVQSSHHRKKIEELLLELSNQRNSLDYVKINRSLELSQLRIKQLQKQLEFSQLRIKELNQQLRMKQSRARKSSQNIQTQKDHSQKAKYQFFDHIHREFTIQPTPTHKESDYYSKQNSVLQQEKYSSPAYDQLMKWREEVRESRANFSKKWVNQLSSENYEHSSAFFPRKEQISF